MTKRGKVLRDPLAGPGLLMVEGQQYRFMLENIWKSEVPPKPGLAVDVDFDSQSEITAITAVGDTQLAKEQAELALVLAKNKGAALLSRAVAKFGVPDLLAAAMLVITWLFLNALSIELPFSGKLEFTFWQLLGYLNSSNLLQAWARHRESSSGIFGVLAIVALVAPFLHHFWKDKRALAGGLLPLFFVLLVGVAIRGEIYSALGPASGVYAELQRQAQQEFLSGVSVGLGAYLSAIAALYFAFRSVTEYLAVKESEPKPLAGANRAAA